MRACVCCALLYCETKTKEVYLENRKHKTHSALIPVSKQLQQLVLFNLTFSRRIKNDDITVYDGDVSAFVVLCQRHGGSLCRGHNPDCAAAVGALQVGSGAEL